MVKKKQSIKPRPEQFTESAQAWVDGGDNGKLTKAKPETADKTLSKSAASKISGGGVVRATLYLSKNLHRRLKAKAAMEDTDMSELAERALQEYLERNLNV